MKTLAQQMTESMDSRAEELCIVAEDLERFASFELQLNERDYILEKVVASFKISDHFCSQDLYLKGHLKYSKGFIHTTESFHHVLSPNFHRQFQNQVIPVVQFHSTLKHPYLSERQLHRLILVLNDISNDDFEIQDDLSVKYPSLEDFDQLTSSSCTIYFSDALFDKFKEPSVLRNLLSEKVQGFVYNVKMDFKSKAISFNINHCPSQFNYILDELQLFDCKVQFMASTTLNHNK